jgi:hypothetical protein
MSSLLFTNPSGWYFEPQNIEQEISNIEVVHILLRFFILLFDIRYSMNS